MNQVKIVIYNGKKRITDFITDCLWFATNGIVFFDRGIPEIIIDVKKEYIKLEFSELNENINWMTLEVKPHFR